MPKSTKTPGAVLMSLISEYGLNPNSLAKALGVSQTTIRVIIFDKIGISVPNALRLAKFFATTPDFWLDLQKENDLIEASKDKELQIALKNIKKAEKPAAVSEASAKPRRKPNLSDKRKKAEKVPGAKPSSRKKK
jgi:addiction module HigA family antidote